MRLLHNNTPDLKRAEAIKECYGMAIPILWVALMSRRDTAHSREVAPCRVILDLDREKAVKRLESALPFLETLYKSDCFRLYANGFVELLNSKRRKYLVLDLDEQEDFFSKEGRKQLRIVTTAIHNHQVEVHYHRASRPLINPFTNEPMYSVELNYNKTVQILAHLASELTNYSTDEEEEHLYVGYSPGKGR